jgi:outer membrane protein TolC
LNVRQRSPRSRFRAALLVLAAVVPGCKSPEAYRAEADRDAYALVQSRRAKLELDTGAFTIEPNPDSLRQRILRNEAPDGEVLTLPQCLEIAAENNRAFQSQKERLYLAALDLTLERWRFAIQTGGTLAALVEGTGDEAETASADAAFSFTKLLGTGATIFGSLGLDFARSLISSDGWHPQSTLRLGFAQPLLAGFGESIVKEPLTQAERNLVYEVRAFERARRQLAFDVASRFYRVLESVDSVKNQENDVDDLVKLTERNRALAESGRLSDIELGQARQNELRSKNDLLNERERLAVARDQFKLFLGLPIQYEFTLDVGALDEIEANKDARIDFPEEVVTSWALAHRLDHLTVLDRQEDAHRRVGVAEDNLRAVLDVVGNSALVSPDGKPAHFDLNDLTWSLGATMSLPFERLPQRNDYRESIINLESAKRASGLSEDQIRSDLREDLRAAETRRDSFTIQVNSVDLARRRIESTTLKLDAGRADTRDLLEARQSLLQAENAVTSALIDYTLARLRLFLDMELLRFDASGIRLELEKLEGAEAESAEAEPEAQQ